MKSLKRCNTSMPPSASLVSSAATPSASPSSSAATHESADSSDDDAVTVVSRTRCTNPGRRRIGGRIYDSILGVTCHWCRQKTVEDHVFCCHCNIAFCGGCLRNRHGEDIEVEMKDGNEWTCPKCRGGCGRGCKNCCNCGPCRKAQGLEPTGLFVHFARQHGFTNVHDFLIHQKTGESEERIAKRKQGKDWCLTDPSTFQRKQKRNEDEARLEATCRKRLNFESTSKASPSNVMLKDDKLTHVASLDSKDGGIFTEQMTHVNGSPSGVGCVHPKPLSDVQVVKEACRQTEVSSLGKDTEAEPFLQCKLIQPKLEPDLHNPEDLRSRAAMSSLRNVTRMLRQSQSEVSPSPSSQHHSTAHTDTQLQIEKASIMHESSARQLLSVKKEPCEFDSSSKLGVPEDLRSRAAMPSLRNVTHMLHQSESEARSSPCSQHHSTAQTDTQLQTEKASSMHESSAKQLLSVKQELCELDKLDVPGNAHGILKNVKTEAEPLCNGTFSSKMSTHLRQVKVESLDRPIQAKEGLSARLGYVKEELDDECSLATHDNIATSKPNVNAAAFFRGEGDATRGSFVAPSVNAGCSTSFIGNASSLASSSISNFHLCPINVMPGFSHVKEGVMNGQHNNATVKIERFSSQEAQGNTASCNVANYSPTDAPDSTIIFPDSQRKAFIAVVKNEREEGWSHPASIQSTNTDVSHNNNVLGNVKLEEERPNFSFTVEPSLCTGMPKSGVFPLSQVKEERIYIDDVESVALLGRGKPEVSEGVKKSSSLGAVSHSWKLDGFKNKLETKLLEPFSSKELEELTSAASHRKPIYKTRETRQGCYQVVSEEDGYSYLDHHPDLYLQLRESVSPSARLSLLRGFFFWLEHASSDGAFKPWTRVSRPPETQESDDCVEIEGPDCEIVAVVCPVDERD